MSDLPKWPSAAYERWLTTPPEDKPEPRDDEGPDSDDLRDELYWREVEGDDV